MAPKTLLTLLLLAPLSLPAEAAVRLAGDAVQADASRTPQRLGEQTLHPVRLDRSRIEAAAASGQLLLPGAGNEPVQARFERIERRDDGLLVWVGKVDTASGARSVVLTVGDGVAFGHIPQASGEPLRIETRGGGIWLVEGGASPEFKQFEPDYIIPPAGKDSRELRQRQEDQAKVIPEPVVEVLVVYTPALVSVMGSNAAVQARIVQLEAISNQAYVDSLAEVRVKVLASHLVDYTVNNDNNVALSEIRTPSALPVKLEVDRLRIQYGADLVAMVRNFDRSTQNSCGIAYLLGYNGSGFSSAFGFSVTSDRGFGGDNCGDYTFAHELGHNMGAAHDFETEDGDSGAFPYSRGYRQDVGDGGFATVMAYPRRPQVRIGTFSNPRLSTCLGLPCGLEDSADNARGLGLSAPIIANFRASVPQTGPSLSISDVSVTEGNSGTRNARFIVSLSAPAASAVTFDLFTSHGTAVASDYTPRSQNGLSIPAGQTSLAFDVVVNGDVEVEFDEVFALNARNVSGAWVLDGQGVATITNDEPIPDFSVANIQIGEGDSGTRDATFTALLSAPSTTPVTFDFASQAYSAASNTGTADVDFGLVTGTGLVIPAGTTSAQFTVPVFGDTNLEQDEAFYIIASNVQAAILVDGMATAWIRDDDSGAPLPTLSIASASTSEGNAGTKTLDFAISLSQPAASAVSFGATTADITATAGSDYVAKSVAGLSIPAGATGATFSVTINGDTTSEADETFRVTLNNVTGADPGTVQATGTISNDDGGGTLPILAARDDRRVMRENGAAASVDVRANDDYDAARLAGGSLSIIAAPGKGSASVNTAGTAGTAADDLVVYTPQAGAFGDDSLRYRLCEGSGGRCVEATLRIVLRPLVDVSLETTTGRGFADLTLEGLVAMPDAVFSVTRASRAERLERALGADSTPATPWDEGMAGTAVVTGNVAPSAGPGGPIDTQARVLVDANAIGGADIDLYMGLDLDGDGQAEASEVRCVSATSAAVERCELALQIAAGDADGVDYWVMAHSRSGAAQSARLDIYRASLEEVGGYPDNHATGPGMVPAGASFPLRFAMAQDDQVVGEPRYSYVVVQSAAGAPRRVFPVRTDRTAAAPRVRNLLSSDIELTIEPGQAAEYLYFDLPAGASQLTLDLHADELVEFYLAPSNAPGTSATIAAAPPRNAASHNWGVLGTQRIVVPGAELIPGRYYLTPANVAMGIPGGPRATRVSIAVSVQGTVAPTARGSWFNPNRSGHGLFLYPAGGQWAGLWYTYFQDGTPTWYYLQGDAPGADGIWNGELYRAAWNGSSNRLTAVGEATVTPTAADGMNFSYVLDGESGAEPMSALGSGCPTLGGQPLDASSHWFDPARAGTGYSVQMFPNYEFFAAFVYDGRGVPRFLTSEAGSFLGADASIDLEQLTGFCPLCVRTGAPTRADIGTLQRRFNASGLVQVQLDAIYTGGVPGTWTGNDSVQLLGGPGTTQGCAVD